MVLTSDGRYTDPLAIPANEAHVAGNLRTLSEFSVPEINQRLRSYLKFIFVREPFERLVSAYRNKFTRSYNTAFHKRYGTKIIRRYRSDPDPEALQKGSDVSFHEFVQYLVDPRTQWEEPFNEHWERMHSLCHPCLIHYDVVGKYETLEPDAQAVLRVAGVEKTLQFPTSGKSTRTDGNMAASFFEHIGRFYKKKLLNLYRMDFLLFNYSVPEYLRTWQQTDPLQGPLQRSWCVTVVALFFTNGRHTQEEQVLFLHGDVDECETERKHHLEGFNLCLSVHEVFIDVEACMVLMLVFVERDSIRRKKSFHCLNELCPVACNDDLAFAHKLMPNLKKKSMSCFSSQATLISSYVSESFPG